MLAFFIAFSLVVLSGVLISEYIILVHYHATFCEIWLYFKFTALR